MCDKIFTRVGLKLLKPLYFLATFVQLFYSGCICNVLKAGAHGSSLLACLLKILELNLENLGPKEDPI